MGAMLDALKVLLYIKELHFYFLQDSSEASLLNHLTRKKYQHVSLKFGKKKVLVSFSFLLELLLYSTFVAVEGGN